MPPRLKRFFDRFLPQIDRALDRALPKASERPRVIHRAMRYSVEAGGKRLRPILVLAAAEACGGDPRKAMPAACALELIHTYSLIHDDLPAMDDDDLRRGRPTNHKMFGEDIAILAGDALLTRAFELLGTMAGNGSAGQPAAKLTALIAARAGTKGMVGGQVADISADRGRWRKIRKGEYRSPEELLSYIHVHKTAALIEASLLAGALVAKAHAGQAAALAAYGRRIGLAFQVADDVLDRVGDKKKLGKRGSDQANRKLTYPALFGLEASKKHAHRLIGEAHRALAPFGPRAAVLHDLADYIVQRDR